IGFREADLSGVRESVEMLKGGHTAFEFRTTVVDELHEAEDFEEIGRWIEGAEKYFLQAFSDRESVPFAGFHAPSQEKMQEYARISSRYVPHVSLRGV
ncbi:MAG: anaerobic ribonucleoside-triphosphate reductase activating protein, partial [Clostridia bacterium]|nr:anaerobic ribonucleoside-triphosphate reductase activating protein [Clostridia bacterium]